MANAWPTMKLISNASTRLPSNIATTPMTTANTLNIRIRSLDVDLGRSIRP
ncbi:hypothetical protein D3C83_245290 [compost metagenome]